MARKRMLSPSWAKHADLYDAEVDSGLPLRVAFAALWTVTDRRGVFAWSRNLKPDVLPYDPCDMLAVLDALAAAGFVEKYQVDGKLCGYIPSFADHQHFHRDEKPSTLPDYPAGTPKAGVSTVPAPVQRVGSTASNGRLATSDIRHTTSDIRLATEEEASSSDVQRLLDGLPNDTARMAWGAEINAALQGMHGAPLTQAQIDQACRDYVGNGNLTTPSLRHFRAFLASAGRPTLAKPTATTTTDGDAGQVCAAIRALITEQPNPGRGMIRLIPKAKVQEMGERAYTAYEQVGGAARFLDQTEKIGFLIRDFANAYNGAPPQRASA